jgi:uncharacterized membrane protein YhaH (DUF805 family)
MAEQMGFWGVVAKSWASALSGVFHLPMLSVSAGIGLVLMGWADSWLFPGQVAILLGHNADALHLLVLVVHMLLVAAVSSLITAPLAVAIHRFVLLGERDDRFFWAWRPEVRRFYLWVLLFNVLALLPELCQFLTTGLSPGLVAALGFVGDVVVIFFSVRVMMIFPATAVNSLRATVKECLRISRGHFWYFFGVLSLVMMPVFVIFMLMIVTSLSNSGRSLFELRVMADILALIFVPILAAAASWLYRKFDSASPPDRSTTEFTLGRP